MNEIGRNYQGGVIPRICCLSITDNCMLRCKMCYAWRTNEFNNDLHETEITYWERFIKELRDFVAGKLCVYFVGGESLLNKKTLDLIKYASGLGCETVLTSNGYLINEEIAKKIADSGLKDICLSLDSIRESSHDFLRGVKGSFLRVINAIEYLNRHAKNIRIKINTVIMDVNLDEIIDLTNWVINNNAVMFVNFQAITQPFYSRPDDFWYEKKEYAYLWPRELKKVKSVIEELIELKKKNTSKINNPISQLELYKLYFQSPQNYIKQTMCHIYKEVINVSPAGEITICCNMEPIGSIKQDKIDIKELWFSGRYEAVKNNIRNCRKNCHLLLNCYYDENELYIG